jgi:hypothetical protein
LAEAEEQKDSDEEPAFTDTIDSVLFQSCVDSWQKVRVPSELYTNIDDDSKKEAKEILRELGYSKQRLMKGIFLYSGYLAEKGLTKDLGDSANQFLAASKKLKSQAPLDMSENIKTSLAHH